MYGLLQQQQEVLQVLTDMVRSLMQTKRRHKGSIMRQFPFPRSSFIIIMHQNDDRESSFVTLQVPIVSSEKIRHAFQVFPALCGM